MGVANRLVFHEQRPEDWWQAICRSTRLLLDRVKEQNICKEQICALAISGHSLVGIPMDREGRPLVGQVPIWSDGRAEEQARRFFETHDYNAWYETTGNGDPPACYTLFKIMWMRENQPELYEKTAYILGSKDYINFRLTGVAGTDYSYASGTGAFDLRRMCYVDAYIQDAGLRRELFLEPGQSHELLGRVTVQAAAEIGLCPGTLVARGGVDNACMALGSCGLGDDRVYMSLGSCAWISATTRQPVLDSALHPFVFAHVEKGWYVLSGQTERDVTATANWDGLKAQERMDTILSTYYKGDTRIDAVMCNNDAIALGVLASLKNVGYGTAEKPFPIITGMDCDIANIKAIKSGEISMTVFKDNRIIAKKAAEVMDCVLHDKTPQAGDAFETTFNNGVCDVTAFLIAPEVIDKDNYQAVLFDSGYYSEDQLK